jgi:hypothetical protein
MYRIAEYYAEELADWDRTLTFHKEESGDFERRLAQALRSREADEGLEKEGSALLDLFLVQHQRFDHLHKQIENQQHRLDGNVPGQTVAIANPFTYEQNSLRSRMQSVEKEFIRTKYNGYLFLCSILKDK